jgi:hypothetical protein
MLLLHKLRSYSAQLNSGKNIERAGVHNPILGLDSLDARNAMIQKRRSSQCSGSVTSSKL